MEVKKTNTQSEKIKNFSSTNEKRDIEKKFIIVYVKNHKYHLV